MTNKLKEDILHYSIMPFFWLFLLILHIVSILLYPLFRVRKKEIIRYEIPIMFKAIRLQSFLRDPIENMLKNRLVYFDKKNSDEPYYLYINHKELKKLPQEIYDAYLGWYTKDSTQTLVVVVETQKLRWIDGYLPAKILSYRVVEGKPRFSK